MQTHRTETIVAKDGSVTVKGVSFAEGEEVEVIVLPRARWQSTPNERPLRGSVRCYADPLDPAV